MLNFAKTSTNNLNKSFKRTPKQKHSSAGICSRTKALPSIQHKTIFLSAFTIVCEHPFELSTDFMESGWSLKAPQNLFNLYSCKSDSFNSETVSNEHETASDFAKAMFEFEFSVNVQSRFILKFFWKVFFNESGRSWQECPFGKCQSRENLQKYIFIWDLILSAVEVTYFY